jgi:transcriptional regulator with XRE-family HTH domain
MAMMFVPKGEHIKNLRENRETGYLQKTIAGKTGISERRLRRIENENIMTKAEDLRRLAAALDTTLDDISFAPEAPSHLAIRNGESALSTTSEELSEFKKVPRHGTHFLRPVRGAADLYDEAGYAQEIVPHILVEPDPERFALIEELLSLLQGIMLRQWHSLGPATPDCYDDLEFPDIGRQKRISELLVLLKGNDIRVVADTHMKYYQDRETPWLEGQKYYTQLLIGFAPPDEYGEETVVVPVDHGKDLKIPRKPIPPAPRNKA